MPVGPDTKDWTWVLERPCPECGFDASTVTKRDIAPMTRASASSWVVQLSRDDAARRTREDRWSTLEYGCHVRDVLRVFLWRLELMVQEDGATFEDWDQDETARRDRYDRQDPRVVAQELDGASAALASRFDAVEGAQWDRAGTRSNGSRFTVESLGIYMIHDPVHHLWDVSARPAADDG